MFSITLDPLRGAWCSVEMLLHLIGLEELERCKEEKRMRAECRLLLAS